MNGDFVCEYMGWVIKKNDHGYNMLILCVRWSEDFYDLKKSNKYFKRYAKTIEPVILSKKEGYSTKRVQTFMAYADSQDDTIEKMVERFKNMIDKSDLIQSTDGDYDDE